MEEELRGTMESQPRTEEVRPEAESPYSPLYVPAKNESKNNKITICFVVILLIALVAGMIAAVSVLVEGAMKEVGESASSWKNAWEEFVDGMAEEEIMQEWQDEYFGDDYDSYDDYEDYGNYDEYSSEPYVPNENDEYYVKLADSIRDDLSYSVDKEIYKFSDADMGVNILVEYVSVDGSQMAFEEKINEALENGAMYYAKEFGAGDASDFTLLVSSYVTYMDEDVLSVVVDERYSWGYDTVYDLYCMNFDLKTGALLYNTNIIESSEELAQAFMDMSEYQNGQSVTLSGLSAEDIASYFEDEDTLILFYTPVGLEIGFNHPDGWITATLKDYEEFLSKI